VNDSELSGDNAPVPELFHRYFHSVKSTGLFLSVNAYNDCVFTASMTSSDPNTETSIC